MRAWPVSDKMKKCPFRKFDECLHEECMAWAGSDCRMFAVSAMFTGIVDVQMPAAKPVINPNTQTETPAAETSADNGAQEKQEKNLVAKVTVSEVTVTKNGNTRAECRVENGKVDQVVIAKNGVGKVLQEGQNKKFEIEYNIMKDGNAWFAIKTKQLQ